MRVKKTIHGQEMEVEMCPPSKRRANSSIQKPKYQRSSAGAKYIAKENGQIETPNG